MCEKIYKDITCFSAQKIAICQLPPNVCHHSVDCLADKYSLLADSNTVHLSIIHIFEDEIQAGDTFYQFFGILLLLDVHHGSIRW